MTFAAIDLQAFHLDDLTDRLVLADLLEDTGADVAARLLRTLDPLLPPLLAGRRALRDRGGVEPECLRIHQDGHWYWCFFRPVDGRGRRGYSCDLQLELIRRAKGQSEWLSTLLHLGSRPGSPHHYPLTALSQCLDLPRHEARTVRSTGEIIFLDLLHPDHDE